MTDWCNAGLSRDDDRFSVDVDGTGEGMRQKAWFGLPCSRIRYSDSASKGSTYSRNQAGILAPRDLDRRTPLRSTTKVVGVA